MYFGTFTMDIELGHLTYSFGDAVHLFGLRLRMSEWQLQQFACADGLT
jgi:hypothetical protein